MGLLLRLQPFPPRLRLLSTVSTRHHKGKRTWNGGNNSSNSKARHFEIANRHHKGKRSRVGSNRNKRQVRTNDNTDGDFARAPVQLQTRHHKVKWTRKRRDNGKRTKARSVVDVTDAPVVEARHNK